MPPVYPREFEEFDSSEYLLFYRIHFSLGYCQFVQILCIFFSNYLFSASPYVIVIVHFRNCFRSIVLFS